MNRKNAVILLGSAGVLLIILLLIIIIAGRTNNRDSKETAASVSEESTEETLPFEEVSEDTVPASESASAAAETAPPAETTESETPPPETVYVEPTSLRLLAVGDMLMHKGISNICQTGEQSYNYERLFYNIQPDLQSCDLKVVNNEVIFGGNELGNLGYPEFNVHTDLGDSELRAGFNVILGATNHCLDQYIDGVFNTINYWNMHPEAVLLGLHENEAVTPKVTVVERNGIRIGMLNMTYGVNDHYLPPENSSMIDFLTDEQRYRIADQIAWADQNTDFVIVFPHWGDEYSLHHNEKQEEWARLFTEFGADLIIGIHTHTIQENEWITAWNGNTALCYYSIGNFVSLQAMTINMLGMMPKITLYKDSEGTRISAVENEYLFTYFPEDFSDIGVYKLNQVSEEMLRSHWVSCAEPLEDVHAEMNALYPMTMESLQRLAENR